MTRRRTAAQRCVDELLKLPPAEVEPLNRKADLSDMLPKRRFGESPASDIDFSALPACTDEAPAERGIPGRPKKNSTPWRTPYVE